MLNDYMKNLMEGIKIALVDYGAMLEDWKLSFVEAERIGNSDMINVTVTITKKRCRKPFMIWTLRIDEVRELVYFDRSTFEYL